MYRQNLEEKEKVFEDKCMLIPSHKIQSHSQDLSEKVT